MLINFPPNWAKQHGCRGACRVFTESDDIVGGEHMKQGEVNEEVNRRHNQKPACHRPGQQFFRVFHFTAESGKQDPAVIRK